MRPVYTHTNTPCRHGHDTTPMTMVIDGCIDDIWADADVAREMNCPYTAVATGPSGVDSDEEDEYGNNLLLQEARAVDSTMVRLQDGDIHLCGANCPYAVMCKRTSDLVCPFSSMVVGHVTIERTDYSTGRNSWSADPDMQGGNAHGNFWRKKIDKVAASKQAHIISKQLDDSIMPTARIQQRVSTNPKLKRGALCVDEKVDPCVPAKKARMSKKNIASTDQMQNMVSEAGLIFTNLMVVKPNDSTSTVHTTKAAAVDKRLLNVDILFNSALRKYLKEQAESGFAPCMDDIHNIALAVEQITSTARHKIKETTGRARFHSVKFKEAVSRLAVSLWKGACTASHMGTTRRGGDSFRPFCVGVYYSLKRGLTLSDGTVLVPAFEDFQGVFPSYKEINANSTTKALHASSHRGLCSIHRCLASMDLDTQHTTFGPAMRLNAELLAAR